MEFERQPGHGLPLERWKDFIGPSGVGTNLEIPYRYLVEVAFVPGVQG